jgi:hypothetical protein
LATSENIDIVKRYRIAYCWGVSADFFFFFSNQNQDNGGSIGDNDYRKEYVMIQKNKTRNDSRNVK